MLMLKGERTEKNSYLTCIIVSSLIHTVEQNPKFCIIYKFSLYFFLKKKFQNTYANLQYMLSASIYSNFFRESHIIVKI